MNRTSIEWVKNPDGTQGYTWNPITGCLNGCSYCYARKLANGRLKQRYLANNDLAPTMGEGVTPYNTSRLIDSLDPFYPRFWPERLIEPMHKYRRWGKHNAVIHEQSPKGIFVCDMSDLFGIGIPEEWTQRVMNSIKKCPQHRFYLLTKQPQNLIKFSPFPDNCWVGVTATDGEMAWTAMVWLRQIKARIKYISFEPLLNPLHSHDDKYDLTRAILTSPYGEPNVDWLIIGAQTKPYKPPKIKWVKEIVDACIKANIPVFLKNNLKPLLVVPGVVEEGEFELRQEMPEGR